jgi:hypothetical protein
MPKSSRDFHADPLGCEGHISGQGMGCRKIAVQAGLVDGRFRGNPVVQPGLILPDAKCLHRDIVDDNYLFFPVWNVPEITVQTDCVDGLSTIHHILQILIFMPGIEA